MGTDERLTGRPGPSFPVEDAARGIQGGTRPVLTHLGSWRRLLLGLGRGVAANPFERLETRRI